MTTLTIEIPDKVGKTITDLIEQLGGKVLSTDGKGDSRKGKKKQEILNDLEESVKFIKLHQAGKVKAKSAQDLLNEL
jgi:cysteine synthase